MNIKTIDPKQAFSSLQKNKESLLIDVRSHAEFAFVGHPVSAISLPWQDFPGWSVNPHFLEQVEQEILQRTGKVSLDTPIYLICRSGKRSENAAFFLAENGFTQAYNVLEGFEGDLNEQKQRSKKNGWKFHQLPWEQN